MSREAPARRLAGHGVHDEPPGHRVVGRRASGFAPGHEVAHGRPYPIGIGEQVEVEGVGWERRDARSMGQDLAQRDCALAVTIEPRQVSGDGLVEDDHTLLREFVHHHRGDGLGSREQVERRVEIERLEVGVLQAAARRDTVGVADGTVEHDVAVEPDAQLHCRVDTGAVQADDPGPHRLHPRDRDLLPDRRHRVEVVRDGAPAGEGVGQRTDEWGAHGPTS